MAMASENKPNNEAVGPVMAIGFRATDPADELSLEVAEVVDVGDIVPLPAVLLPVALLPGGDLDYN